MIKRIVFATVAGIVFVIIAMLAPDAKPIECSTFGMTTVIWAWFLSGEQK